MPIRLPRFRFACLVALLLALVGAGNPVQAEDLNVAIGGNEFRVPRRSFADMRFTSVVRQRMDFSCGSAALATLLTYSYDVPVDELAILSDMYEHGDQEKIKKEGFSLLDMKNYLAAIGIRAEGYRESLDKLVKVGIPAIVLINHKSYMHFVVVKGVTKDKVLIGDPAIGLIVYNRTEFEKMWNNILFVVLDLKHVARKHFNSPELWAKRRQVLNPYTNTLNTGLSTFTLSITNPSNYY